MLLPPTRFSTRLISASELIAFVDLVRGPGIVSKHRKSLPLDLRADDALVVQVRGWRYIGATSSMGAKATHRIWQSNKNGSASPAAPRSPADSPVTMIRIGKWHAAQVQRVRSRLG
jgi:hypothetical protein